MAGDSRDRIKQYGKVIQATLSLSLNYYSYLYYKYSILITGKIDNEIKEFKLLNHHINYLQQHISRLLYTNLNISHYEHTFIKYILNDTSIFSNDIYETYPSYSFENASSTSVNESNSTLSDMANSGLESGSMTSPQETISENSSTDLDEPHESMISKKNTKKSKVCQDVKFSMKDNFNEQKDSTQNVCQKRDEISEYENQIQRDSFYELYDESDDDITINSHIPVPSFTFNQFDPISLSVSNNKKNDEKLNGAKITQNGKSSNIFVEKQCVDINNSSVSSNYYFIDASTLNDDIDTTTKNVVVYSNDNNGRYSWSPQIPSCYTLLSGTNNSLNNDPLKLLNKQENSQNRYKEASELERNFNLTEYLEPCTKSQHINIMDSLIIQDDKINNSKNINKESLTVEVKETDSGESTQHSPCQDNIKHDSIQKAHIETIKINTEQERQEDDKQNDYNEKRVPFIRRNTFELDSNDEKLSNLRREYERWQGSVVFQNSITQYSQHLINDDLYFDNIAQPNLSIINNLTSNIDSQLPIIGSVNLTLDKYNLNMMEIENESNALCPKIDKKKHNNLLSRSTSEKLLNNFKEDETNLSSSLPLNVNDELVSVNLKIRRNEDVPILSGGAKCPEIKKCSNTPNIHRKTEKTPIVSGGSIMISESYVKEKLKPKNTSHSTTAWVVDMSDCKSSNVDKRIILKKTKEPQIGMSSSLSSSNLNPDKKKDRDKENSQHSSLGYFVNFNEIESPNPLKDSSSFHKCCQHNLTNEKSHCEFFIDLSDKTNKKFPEKLVCPFRTNTSMTTTNCQSNDNKKNMFSMFIDLSEPESSTSVTKSSSSSKPTNNYMDQQPTIEKKLKPGVFMFIESDSPIVRRRTFSNSRPAFKRHSWNTDKSNEQISTALEQPVPIIPRKVHKRAQSLSVERLGEFCKIVGETHERKFNYEPGETPPNSHVQVIDEELLLSVKNRNHQEFEAIKEQAINETRSKLRQFEDSYSETSVWKKTPTDNNDNNQTRKSETFDVSSNVSELSSNSDVKFIELIDTIQEKLRISTEPIQPLDNNRMLLQSSENTTEINPMKHPSAFSIVRLSDLDKRPLSQSVFLSTIDTTNQKNSYRLSNSVTEMSWIESKLAMSTRTAEPVHKMLIKKYSENIANGQLKTEDEVGPGGDFETVISESDISSLQSSGPSGQEESTEDTETSTSFTMGKPYNRLGEDLLRMFLEEINPDVTIDVAGRHIRAHKCILSSRCQYFAALLSGSWLESAGNIISLQGYSYNAVHFALCHIYSGENCIPDSISIIELATLADMLCLEGLKEIIGFTLKIKLCHLFHKPCTGCAAGVLECLPLAAAYGLDELYRKSLRWITRHFVKIWPTKEFSTLPRELMEKCYHQHIVHMSCDNVLQTIMDCDKLLATLPNVRWAKTVFRLISNLLDASMKYLTDNYIGILENENLQCFSRELTWNISRLEDHLLVAAERLSPEQACKAFSKLHKMLNCPNTDDIEQMMNKWSPFFTDLINKIIDQVEKSLIRDAAQAAKTNAWVKMDFDIRNRIQNLASLVILPNEVSIKRPSRHSNFLKEPKERKEPKTPVNRIPPNRTLDLRRMKMTISEHNDKTCKQTSLQTRKIMNKPKTDPLERKLQNDKLSNDTSNVSRPKSWPNKIGVKSRYLEPRNRLVTKQSVQTNQEKISGQQKKKIMISSSDSSRTASPAIKRTTEKKQLSITKVSIKKDGKALSSDSLTDASSHLSLKKDFLSKTCGITRPESPLLKLKKIESGISIDSLADSKKKPLVKKISKMDTSMSTDSLMTDITTLTTSKSTTTNKLSPILGKVPTNLSRNQPRNFERLKKFSPTQQRNTLIITRRPARSLENSTAASRNRAAAVISTYQSSLNLRKSLLDAARAPDIPSKPLSSTTMIRTSLRQNINSMRSSYITASNKFEKCEKKEETVINNQRFISSPSTKRSPKSSINSRLIKSTIITTNKLKQNKFQDKSSNKAKSQLTGAPDKGPKFLNQSSRSGTFLKDEPTILNKSDIQTSVIDF